MKRLMVLGCALAGMTLIGAGLMMAADPGAGRGARPVTAQLPLAPALAETPVLEIKADQVKGKYPHIKVISCVAEAPKIGENTTPDVQDDHHYMSPPGMLGMWNKYDSYDRKASPPLLLGEWATGMRNGGANPQAPNLEYGLCDGVAAIQFERNSDLILNLKVVNPTDAPLPLHVKITGVSSIEPTGQIGEVKGTDPLDLNTITEREKIVSTMSKADGLSTDFTRTFAPYSANVLILKGK